MSASEASVILKREIRKRVKDSLRGLSHLEIQRQSESLTDQFLRSKEYRACTSIGLYSSMPQEFNTHAILKDCFDQGKRVFLPRVVKPACERFMVMLEVKTAEEVLNWAPNNWGIREPPLDDGRADAPKDAVLDLVIVPGVAFDASGARCGHGMGFYDCYLRRYSSQRSSMPCLIALALRPQIIDNVPMTEQDWHVDRVITPKR